MDVKLYFILYRYRGRYLIICTYIFMLHGTVFLSEQISIVENANI